MKILNKIIMFSIILFSNKINYSLSFYNNINNRLFIKTNIVNLNTYKNVLNKIETKLNLKKSNSNFNKLLNFEPKTENQKIYYNNLKNQEEKKIFICYGPPGTGKSFISCVSALYKLEKKEIDRIIITRPAVSVENEDHGFLPGDLNKKMHPWVSPILDIFDEFKGFKGGEKMLKDGSLVIIPLAFMRGRTFKNSIIIADEMQNSSPRQMKMLLTRLGNNSKIIINGDLEQTDIHFENGLNNLINLYNNYENKNNLKYFDFIKMTKNDIQRSKVVEEVYSLYNNEDNNNNNNNYIIDYINSDNITNITNIFDNINDINDKNNKNKFIPRTNISNTIYKNDYNDYNELDEMIFLDDRVDENENESKNKIKNKNKIIYKNKIIKVYSNKNFNINNTNINNNDDSALIPINHDYFYKVI